MTREFAILPDNALVAAMRRGDQAALTELRRRYFLTLYAKAYSIVFDPVTSESVVDHVFHSAWHAAATLGDQGPGSVHGWLLALLYARTARPVPIPA